jgi:hypothetical protein
MEIKNQINLKKEYYITFADQINYLNKLDKQYINSIKEYTTSDYYEELNDLLRKNKPLPNNLLTIFNNINKVLENIPPIKKSVTVYRSINADALNLDFVNKHFISTSMISDPLKYPHERYNKKCCFMQITISAGSRCLPILFISEDQEEYEVLLNYDLKWIVNNISINVKNQKTYYITTINNNSYDVNENKSAKDLMETPKTRILNHFKNLNKPLKSFELRTELFTFIEKNDIKNITKDEVSKIYNELEMLYGKTDESESDSDF